MSKIFEDLFMDLQADMVFACMDYVKGVADKIYIYISCEGAMTSNDYFFEINGQVVPRHELDKISPIYDVSLDNQEKYNMILLNITRELENLCEEYNKPMPTEIKMIYDVKKNSLDVNYKYDNQWLDHETLSPDNIADQWYEKVKNSKR